MEEVNGLVRRKSYDGSDLMVDKSRLGFLNVVHGGGNCVGSRRRSGAGGRLI